MEVDDEGNLIVWTIPDPVACHWLAAVPDG